ncbi:MAG: UDP-N-acetylmuramoyl-L-alanyl-D-glutamate--2,6-diaminopimelate ligase [Weeksellaceae bacterium]|nr:UDP-N-acetylmuramoyl-L-alanyl-D-glutamate--2,6-diaminopimelate ligase [Weeksellaceae bacterium]
MRLAEVLHGVEVMEWVNDSLETQIQKLTLDSREVSEGDCFFAVKGFNSDGHLFIENAVKQGAKAVVCEALPANISPSCTYVRVKNSSVAIGTAASNFYGRPSEQLKLVGITGTNGKTTTATLMYELSRKLGYASALISTIRIKINDSAVVSTHTTPHIVKINAILAEAVEAGCEYAFMEVSSHGIDQKRIEGLHFHVAGFTNITHDHLDYHQTFHNYIKAKKAFFDNLDSNAVAITNLDDKNGLVMVQNTKATKIAYALKTDADYKGKILENQFSGMLLNFNGTEFYTRLVGQFNAYNLLLVYAVSDALHWVKEEVLKALSELGTVDGRFQNYTTTSGVHIIVDYAHTPDALENVLNTLQQTRTRNETLFVVVGCGGDRDKTKRPEMAKVAVSMGDKAIFTSDNPRSEDPEEILKDMIAGVPAQFTAKYLSVTNRREAIKTALMMAQPNDIILLAGKGHETYQEIKGVKHDFDDMQVAQEISKQFQNT